MQLKELKTEFTKALSGIYPAEEVQSFFGLLSEAILKYTRYETVLNATEVLSEEKIRQFQLAMGRLTKKEPIQYIIGSTEFYGLHFRVTPDTLIPRPETEELVSWIISDCEANESVEAQVSVLDIGTGSGCIAISLAKQLANGKVSALDFATEALAVAKQNAKEHEVDVTFLEQDILTTSELPKKYDLIVSNPPYVRTWEKALMDDNVLSYEPPAALFVSDSDPLLFYRAIAKLATQYLKPHGKLFFEINEYLAIALSELLTQLGFSEIVVRKDIFGKDRMICCQLKSEATHK